MRQTIRKALLIALGVSGTVAVTILSAWAPDPKPTFQSAPLSAVLFQYRMHMIVLCAIASAVGTVATGWTGSRKKSIEYFLDHLHRRSWNKSAGKHPDYRVAFFVERPWSRGSLTCYVRTDGRRSTKKWSKSPPVGRDFDGVVGLVWQTGMVTPIKALSASPSPADVARYQKETYIDPKTYDSLSWKGCAMLGVPVQLSPDGPIGVLLVECRIENSEINVTEFSRDAEVTGMIWEGRL